MGCDSHEWSDQSIEYFKKKADEKKATKVKNSSSASTEPKAKDTRS